jgi:hypothetical protein
LWNVGEEPRKFDGVLLSFRGLAEKLFEQGGADPLKPLIKHYLPEATQKWKDAEDDEHRSKRAKKSDAANQKDRFEAYFLVLCQFYNKRNEPPLTTSAQEVPPDTPVVTAFQLKAKKNNSSRDQVTENIRKRVAEKEAQTAVSRQHASSMAAAMAAKAEKMNSPDYVDPAVQASREISSSTALLGESLKQGMRDSASVLGHAIMNMGNAQAAIQITTQVMLSIFFFFVLYIVASVVLLSLVRDVLNFFCFVRSDSNYRDP